MTDITRDAFDRMLVQFESDPEPDWDTLLEWSDVCEEIGEDRLALIARWVVEHEKWPYYYQSGKQFSWTRNSSSAPHCLPHDLLARLDNPGPCNTFLDVFHALSTALHLQLFEEDPTPRWDEAISCADWLETRKRRTHLVQGIRHLHEKESWPTRIKSNRHSFEWLMMFSTFETWAEAVEAVGAVRRVLGVG